jgi:GNAT superfamily N-acetyltransferase
VSPAYEVLKYRPEHKARIAELQCDLWSSDPSLNTAYLEWKYEKNPYVSAVPIYLAAARGEIVAMRGFFGSRWEAGRAREEAFAYCGDDLVIAPAHRNKGVFTLMMKAAMDDLRASSEGFALTLSAGMATTLGSLTMGWKSIGQTLPVRWVSQRTRLLKRVRWYASAIPILRRSVEWLPAPGWPERFRHLDANARAASPSAGPSGLRAKRVRRQWPGSSNRSAPTAASGTCATPDTFRGASATR